MKSGILRPLLIAGSLALAFPFATQAHPGGGFDGHAMHGEHGGKSGKGGFGRGHGFMRGLDLTEAQRDKIFQIRHAAAPTLREKGKQAHAVRGELRKLAHAEKFDEARARSLSEQAARADAEFTIERLRVQQQVYAVLTPEQRKQAEERRGRHGPKKLEPQKS